MTLLSSSTIEGLRSTEAARIAQAQARPLSGIVAQVGTRAENYVIDEAVLIQTAADKQRPMLVFPLVLQVGADDVHLLLRSIIVADRFVVQIVVVVFHTQGQVGGKEPQPVERMDVLGAGRHGKVVRAAVGIGILLGTVVALAGDVLERSIDIHTVGVVGGREVEREAAAVDVVVGLLGDHRFVRRRPDGTP